MSHNDIKEMLIGDLISVVVPSAVVDLSSNHFEGPLPAKFNEVDLLSLDVSNNHLSGPLDQFLCFNTTPSNKLQVLDLANNNLSGAIPDCWLSWGSLVALNFENNGLSGEIPQSFGNLSYLQSFNIRNNKLSGKIPASLLNLNRLQILELSENEFTGSIPLSIGREETKLKLLSLRSNNLEGAIPDELCGLTQIQILDVAHNSLSGTLPTCFYNFSTMSEKQNMSVIEQSHGSALMAPTERGDAYYEYVFDFKVQIVSLVTKGSEYEYSTNLVTALDLSGNQFSGLIPEDLMSLVGLRYMNLSGNHLTGRIPEEIGKMTSLESLDMSLNQLDGTIPWSISGLSLLSSFNVSFNKFTGEIPKSTQLQSLNESSFMGNALCGPPLAELCHKKMVPPDAESTRDLSSDGQNWGLIISIVLGFIIRFWAVIAPLIASKVWRSVYFCFLYKAWFKICDVCCNHRHG